MALRLYNSLSQRIEDFKPLEDKKIKIYVCGITPYDTTHLGHAFVYTQFDALNRFLKHKGYEVTYVQNVTDIDDDILRKAKEEGKDWKELGEFWTQKFVADLKSLNIELPNHFVKATDSIPRMIEIIHDLLKKDIAYTKNGNVYYDIKKYPLYGSLSRLNEKQMLFLAKERGLDPDDPNKKNKLDFLLWQAKSPVDESETFTTQPVWDTPWGKGRPGWHIECSAMIREYLGEQIDIHGGGRDLIYPHHESEIAQSEMYTGRSPFVSYWMHIAMLMYQGEKMSKSLGNLVMVSNLLKTYSPNAIRYLLLSHHYRKLWEYDEEDLKIAEKKVKLLDYKINNPVTEDNPYFAEFVSFLDNDFQTDKALEYLLSLVRGGLKDDKGKISAVVKGMEMLGFK